MSYARCCALFLVTRGMASQPQPFRCVKSSQHSAVLGGTRVLQEAPDVEGAGGVPWRAVLRLAGADTLLSVGGVCGCLLCVLQC